jgi:hypothetical protein
MPRIIEQWLLFKYVDGEFAAVETLQDEAAGGKSAAEILGEAA